MQEKIIEEMNHWGEEEDYTQENLEAYEIFRRAVEEIVEDNEGYTLEETIDSLKDLLKDLEEELR